MMYKLTVEITRIKDKRQYIGLYSSIIQLYWIMEIYIYYTGYTEIYPI